jgi:hypothetical protein
MVNSIMSLPPKERKMNNRRSDCKNRAVVPVTGRLKEIIAKYQMLTITLGARRAKTWVHIASC